MGTKIVVIGGVAAGPKAAARARRLDPQAEITLIERDDLLSYAGCGLPYYVGGAVSERKQLLSTPAGVERDVGFFAKVKNIKVLNGTVAVGIDRQARQVEIQTKSGGEVQRLPYDKLILATGAETTEPPIPGKDLGNVLRLKKVEDADHFRAYLEAHPGIQLVIVGGGLIGLEMAEAARERGCQVTVVEMLPHVAPMLDADMAVLVEKHLREKGVQLVTGARVERFEGDAQGQLTGVVTSSGTLPAAAALLAVGMKPNVELAKKAGLLLGASGGIAVNQYMQTSDPNIYAAGDCTEKNCVVRGTGCFLPLGSVANKEGRVAGSNAVGHASRFPGVAGATALKVFDWNVGRAGLSVEQARGLGIDTMSLTVVSSDRPHYYPGNKPVILKLIADKANRRLIGIQAVGPGEAIKRVDVAITAMTARMSVEEVAELDLAYAPPYSEAMDVLLTCANALSNKLDGLFKSVGALELKAEMDAGRAPFLLDVRTPAECANGCLPGAAWIPLGALRTRAAEVPREGRVVIYCKTSLRAWEAVRILAGLGYRNVELLEGGVAAWPFELGPAPAK
ncbi:MAG: NADH peroxidase [Chloroflexi bacterium ADurb.Bin180]|nr:MAG: NADH peroxidase [Chloroflexi bacterium ADurb.Bin180]